MFSAKNTKMFSAILLSFVLVTGLIGISSNQNNSSIQAQVTTTSEAPNSFANVKVVQDSDYVVITVAKNIEETIPDGPIVVVPPSEENENGTISVPTVSNETTGEVGGNVTIIEPDGEVTVIEDGNVTVVEEGVVVVTEPEQACECPEVDDSGIADVIVTPAPGQNVTVGPEEEPAAAPTPAVEPEPTTTEDDLTIVDNGEGNGVEESPDTEDSVNATEPAPEPAIEPETPIEGSGGEIVSSSSSLNSAFPWLGISA